ncbi:unnamed protein product [Laminaria digitata]
MMPTTSTSITAWRLGAQLGRNHRMLHTPSYPASGHENGHQNGHRNSAVLGLQLEQQPDYEAIKSSMLLQASLAARVQHINATISGLQPKSLALKDPQARKEVNRRLEDLARQGLFITQASRELDAILLERQAAY